MLRTLVHEHGLKAWTVIGDILSSRFNPRSGKQCRLRWLHTLSPAVNSDPWTAEEDKILFQQQVIQGNRWSQIARLLPGRTDSSCKNRWYSTKRHLQRMAENNPTINLLHAASVSRIEEMGAHNNPASSAAAAGGRSSSAAAAEQDDDDDDEDEDDGETDGLPAIPSASEPVVKFIAPKRMRAEKKKTMTIITKFRSPRLPGVASLTNDFKPSPLPSEARIDSISRQMYPSLSEAAIQLSDFASAASSLSSKDKHFFK